MAIAEVEQRAGLEYRQVDGRSFDDAVEVHVAAEAAGIARRSGCEAEVRGNGQPAQHRTQGNGVVLEPCGRVLEARDAVLAVQMPSHPVAQAGGSYRQSGRAGAPHETVEAVGVVAV